MLIENGIKYVESLPEFLQELLFKIGNNESGQKIWFRGHESDEFKLVPGLYRGYGQQYNITDVLNNPDRFQVIEQNIDLNFYRKASQFLRINGIEDTSWNRYFLKQHYGIKTRLLDWTESALIALFFAVSNAYPMKNARVYMLYPYKLNNYSINLNKSIQNSKNPDHKQFHTILTCKGEVEKPSQLFNDKKELRTGELLRRYYRLDCSDKDKLYPLAIYPPHLDDRMSSQQSCFTIFGNIPLGLDGKEKPDEFIDFIPIHKDSKHIILQQLTSIGVNNYLAFPDLEGLGKTINYEFDSEIKQLNHNEYGLNLLNKEDVRE